MWLIPHRIETERLVIRVFEPSDAANLAHAIESNAEYLARYMSWARFPTNGVEGQAAWIATSRSEFDAGVEFAMGIFSRETGHILGGSGYHPREDPHRLDIGFWLAEDQQGHGYVTESSAALTFIGLTLCRSEVVSIAHAPSNIRSEAVPRRLGFVKQPRPAGACADGGDEVNGVVWYATRDQLDEGPLSEFKRPRAFAADGSEFVWAYTPQRRENP